MTRKFEYNGKTYNSLKEIAAELGVNRVRPKNFSKYGITEITNEADFVQVGDTQDVASTTYNTDGDTWFHDPTTRVELVAADGSTFNKRAFVTTVPEENKIIKYLVSFGGVVAKVTYTEDIEGDVWLPGKTAKVYGTYSGKTLEHIKTFLQSEGFVADTCLQIRNDYM